MSAPDNETRAAIEALAHRLRNRGDGEGQFAEDPEIFAAEFMAAMRGRGWRPVLALLPEQRPQVARGSLDPNVKAALLEDLAEATQRARTTGGQPVLTEGRDP